MSQSGAMCAVRVAATRGVILQGDDRAGRKGDIIPAQDEGAAGATPSCALPQKHGGNWLITYRHTWGAEHLASER